MKDWMEESRLLASLAVFRQLYDSKKNVFGIIGEFLKEIIVSTPLHSFSLSEITSLLNKNFDFSIPEAVVKSSLSKLDFLEKENGIYSVPDKNLLASTNIRAQKEEIQIGNDHIIDNLQLFISDCLKVDLTEKQKEEIVHSFCSFLLDGSNGHNYAEYISAYLIKNQGDTGFKRQLMTIKEGVVLYTGIKYNSNINDVGSWNTELTIFIETEVLFHFAGFNGELFESYFNDFHSLVKEVNAKSKFIKLKYFPDVKYEIENFFKKAIHIVEGKDTPNPEKTAMRNILNGCKSASDVLSKQTDFFLQLKSNGIHEGNYDDLFSAANQKYNIASEGLIKEISEDLSIDFIEKHIKALNYINILRGDAADNNFERIGYVLLSGNSTTLKIAWHPSIKNDGQVPLASGLDFITSKLWFKLNKGFGLNNFPKSFDIISKAQIILSSQLSNTVGHKYSELQIELKNGKLTSEIATARIVDLRGHALRPEEIQEDNIYAILDYFSNDDIERFVLTQEHLKIKAKKDAEEKIELNNELSLNRSNIENLKETTRLLKENNRLAKIQHRDEILNKIVLIEKQKGPADEEIRSAIIMQKAIFVTGLLFSYVILFAILQSIPWDKIEPYTYFISFAFPFLVLLYIVVKEKTINPIEIIKNQKQKTIDSKYKQFNYDTNLIERFENEIKEINREIEELNKD
jgi:hypothetical protein